MKFKLLLFCIFLCSLKSSAQVNWSFSSKKVAARSWEIHLKAYVAPPWHIYSQNSPKGGALPTKITLANNPLVIYKGTFIEKGERRIEYSEAFGLNLIFYNDEVDFVGLIKTKADIKTVISGVVDFMICNDGGCLPPDKISFKLQLK